PWWRGSRATGWWRSTRARAWSPVPSQPAARFTLARRRCAVSSSSARSTAPASTCSRATAPSGARSACRSRSAPSAAVTCPAGGCTVVPLGARQVVTGKDFGSYRAPANGNHGGGGLDVPAPSFNHPAPGLPFPAGLDVGGPFAALGGPPALPASAPGALDLFF